MAHSCEALTRPATFWINAIGVWGVVIVFLFLAYFVNLKFGLIALYLPLVNAVIHIVQASVRREYNPGLWTSFALFLPIGGWGLYVVSVESGTTWMDQLVTAGFIVAVHLGLVVYMVRRMMRIRGKVAIG